MSNDPKFDNQQRQPYPPTSPISHSHPSCTPPQPKRQRLRSFAQDDYDDGNNNDNNDKEPTDSEDITNKNGFVDMGCCDDEEDVKNEKATIYDNEFIDDDEDDNVLNGENQHAFYSRVDADDGTVSPVPEGAEDDVITTAKNKKRRKQTIESDCDDNENDDDNNNNNDDDDEISTTQDSSFQARIDDDNDGLDNSLSQMSTTTGSNVMNNSQRGGGGGGVNNSINSSFSIGNNELVDVVDEETMGRNMEVLTARNDMRDLMEFIEQKQYVKEDEVSRFIITLFQETSKKTMVPTEEELTNCLVALEERYGLDNKGTQEDEWYSRTFKYLFGGPSERAEGNVRERLERYQKQYKNEVKMLFTLFQGANLLQGDYNQIYKQKFKEINRAIDNFYSIRILHYDQQLASKTGAMAVEEDYNPNTVDLVDFNDPELNYAQKLILFVGQECNKNGFYKLGRDIMKPIKDEHGNSRNAFERHTTIRDFIYDITQISKNLAQWKNRTKQANAVNQVEKDAIENKESYLPLLKRNRHVWAFRNVFWVADGDKTYKYTETLPNLIACKFINYDLTDKNPVGPDYTQRKEPDGTISYYDTNDKKYNGKPDKRRWMDIETPFVDRIMRDQKFTRLVRKWLYVFLGRLAFEIGEKDNWQVAPLLYGRAGTGKSTIVRHICLMYDKADIFDLESNGESTFQLQNAVSPNVKWLWRILELKRDLKLSAARYQLMVEGGEMGIPVKNLGQWEGRFTLPGIMVGNDDLPFKDAQGSIERRTVRWEFLFKITQETTFMQSLAPELPNDIRKCVLGYLKTVEEVGSRGIHSMLPPYFQMTSARTREATDITALFLAEHTQKVRRVPGALLPYSRFQDALEMFVKAKKTIPGPYSNADVPGVDAIYKSLDDAKYVVIKSTKEEYRDAIIDDDDLIPEVAERLNVVNVNMSLTESDDAVLAQQVDSQNVDPMNYRPANDTFLFDGVQISPPYIIGMELVELGARYKRPESVQEQPPPSEEEKSN